MSAQIPADDAEAGSLRGLRLGVEHHVIHAGPMREDDGMAVPTAVGVTQVAAGPGQVLS
ncbi:hypothetical protein GCM10027421_31310 [Microbacterium shaanxiense]